MEEQQLEIQKQFRNQQEKYIYYLISLCVSAIGFSVYITTGHKLNFSQIPLGISIITWSLSIFYGLKLIAMIQRLLDLNNVYFEILQGKNHISGTDPEKIKVGIDRILKIIQEGSKNAAKYGKRQYNLFFTGMFTFIFWHVIEMYLQK
jgi:hypothetical protein